MSQFNAEALIESLFSHLRQRGFSLGVGEYLAALDAIAGGFGQHPEQLERTLRLLWCHSLAERAQFEPLWQTALQQQQQPSSAVSEVNESNIDERNEQSNREASSASLLLSESAPFERPLQGSQTVEQLAPLPVRAPLNLAETENLPELKSYYPLTRRSMVYNWRYLRRPVPNGPQDVLDVSATVDQAARQGFFIAPAYRRREQNLAKLLLLVDRNGSMVPCHRFCHDLVETAQTESSLQADYVRVFYFQNVPQAYLYADQHLTCSIPLEQGLANCDPETSVLIVSDAGAARGHRRLERIQATTRFLLQLRRQTNLIAWLNPMPERRWLGSSAEIMANLLPMYQMDSEGFSQAIDMIRGQPLHRYLSPFL